VTVVGWIARAEKAHKQVELAVWCWAWAHGSWFAVVPLPSRAPCWCARRSRPSSCMVESPVGER